MAAPKTPLTEIPFDTLRQELADDIRLLQQLLTRMVHRADPLAQIPIDVAASLYEELQQILAVRNLDEDGWKLVKLTQQAKAMLQRAFPKK